MDEHDTLDAQWHQQQLEEQQQWWLSLNEEWELHRKHVKMLEDMLSETKHGWRGMRRVSDGK